MALKLLSASAYEKSNSTIANSRLDTNRGIGIVGDSVCAVGGCERRRRASGSGNKGSAKPGDKEIDQSGPATVGLGDFRIERASRSAWLLGRVGREREGLIVEPCVARFSEDR